MNSDIMLKIAAMKGSMTPAEKKVAERVQSDPRDVIGRSISELAELCGVGETSVFRFCKTLECDGFAGFKMALALSLSDSEMEGIVLSREIARGDDPSLVCDKLLADHIAALQNTRRLVNPGAVSLAVSKMRTAERIVICGCGSSLVAATGAYMRLLRITPKVRCPQDGHTQAMEASLCGPGDVLLAISSSGLTLDTVECAKLARAAGACVVAITRHLRTPLTENAEIVLLEGSSDSGVQPSSASSLAAALYLADLLYVEFFRQNYSSSLENIDKTTSSVTKKLL